MGLQPLNVRAACHMSIEQSVLWLFGSNSLWVSSQNTGSFQNTVVIPSIVPMKVDTSHCYSASVAPACVVCGCVVCGAILYQAIPQSPWLQDQYTPTLEHLTILTQGKKTPSGKCTACTTQQQSCLHLYCRGLSSMGLHVGQPEMILCHSFCSNGIRLFWCSLWCSRLVNTVHQVMVT